MASTADRITIRVILGDRRVRVIIAIVFVTMLGFGIVAPILPLYARSFGVSYGAVGLLVSAFAFARLVTDLVAGPIVDRFGERLSASWGVTVVGVSSLLTGIAPTFPLAVVFRGVGGAGSAVLFAALYSYMLKIVPKDRIGKTMGLFYGTFNVGIVAGGPIGGLIGHFGYRAPIFVYAGLCFVSGVLYVRYSEDPQRAGVSASGAAGTGPVAPVPLLRRTSRSVGELLRNRAFAALLLANLGAWWMFGGVFNTLVPLFARDRLGMSSVGIGAVLAIAFATELATLYPSGSLSDRIGRKRVLIPGYAALGVAVAAVPFAGGPLALGAAMGALGLASGFASVVPTAMLADLAPAEGSGTAVGLFRFANDLGFVLGPLATGWTATHFDFGPAFAVAAAPLLVTVVFGFWTPETLPSARRSS